MNTLKEYNKTWYWKIVPFWKGKQICPYNWIMGTPIRIFGITVAYKWKVAKPNYKWNK